MSANSSYVPFESAVRRLCSKRESGGKQRGERRRRTSKKIKFEYTTYTYVSANSSDVPLESAARRLCPKKKVIFVFECTIYMCMSANSSYVLLETTTKRLCHTKD